MSRFNGSAQLKMAQLGWLSHFEPSRGITTSDKCKQPALSDRTAKGNGRVKEGDNLERFVGIRTGVKD